MSTRDRRRPGARAPAIGLTLAAALLASLALAGRHAACRDPLHRAWSAAQAAGTYHVRGTTRAATAEGTAAYAVAGSGTARGALTLTVRSGAVDDGSGTAGRPSPPDAAGAAITYAIAWPRVTPLSPLAGEPAAPMEPHAVALVFPAGDPLALLAAGHGARAGPAEPVGGRDCARVDFLVAAPAYAAWWLARRDRLPVNADAGGLHKFTAEATVWLAADTGLPCRIAARVDLPRLAGERPGTGEVDWSYEGWGAGGR